MKTAAAYIRVSTEEQAELSPDSQLKELKRYAAAHGYLIPEEYIFVDEGISGKTTAKRPAFNRMIGTAKQKPKPFDAILLWKFSRFARNREDSIVYKSMLRKQLGIEVVSISENLGDDKMAVLIEAMIEAMDEYYSINLAEEVRRGMKEAVSRGKPVASPAFGYRMQDGELVPDPQKAPLVQQIFEDALAGKGDRQMAMELNAQGVRTAKGTPLQNRTIAYILRNPVYIGKIRWNEKAGLAGRYNSKGDALLADGHHAPIIRQELWDRTQAMLEERDRRHVRYRHGYSDTIKGTFKGILRCSNCGATLTYAPATKGYQCCSYARGECRVSHYISEEKLTPLVVDGMKLHLETKQFQHITHRVRKKDAGADLEARRKNLLRMLDQAKRAYLAEVDTLEEYQQNKARIQQELTALEQNAKPDPPADWAEFTRKLRLCIQELESENSTPSSRNTALKNVCEKIIFTRATGSVDIFYIL